MNRLKAFFLRENAIQATYILLSVIIAVQHYVGGPLKYNNFIIFRQSFVHLLDKSNLHIPYPQEYVDIFLYHPTFSILFSPFSILPVLPSLLLWLIGCALAVFYAIRCLPIPYDQKVFFWWYILVELVTALHGQQTNPLIAAGGLLTFSLLEQGKVRWASLVPILAFCIKGYGVIFAAIFLFYPKRGQYVLYSIGWVILLALVPLPVIGLDHFVQVYKDWVTCLVDDHKVNYGFSIMGLVKVWWDPFTEKGVSYVQFAGVGLFIITWLSGLRGAVQSQSRRFLLLAYAFLWVILFNHAAESPTYIIAVQGVAIFYIINRYTLQPWSKVLIWSVFIFSMMVPTDIFPLAWRHDFLQPYLIKVIPCLIVWIVLQVQLLVYAVKPAHR
jgi:hypothetical protein